VYSSDLGQKGQLSIDEWFEKQTNGLIVMVFVTREEKRYVTGTH